MEIKRLVIENFKSIERIELIEPNPFTVFVGPNGSGKSNIFEALEFAYVDDRIGGADSLFGGGSSFLRRQGNSQKFYLEYNFGNCVARAGGTYQKLENGITVVKRDFREGSIDQVIYQQFYYNFTRLFIGNGDLVKLPLNDNQRLALDAKNLEKVLKRVLSQAVSRNEIFEWLELFVPEFKSVEVVANPFSGEETLLWYEQYAEKPFTKELISDGTYNILALLTAIYQSEEPQFLCIEEPENGLHPQVLMVLVDFFRQQCEEKGHYIWLNTHSESIVRCLTTEEIVLVKKKDGATQTRQIKGRNLYDIPTDQAWLSGALGGGLPW